MNTQCQAAFEAWLNDWWPLWRQHVGSIKHHAARDAFAAGWRQHKTSSDAKRQQQKLLATR